MERPKGAASSSGHPEHSQDRERVSVLVGGRRRAMVTSQQLTNQLVDVRDGGECLVLGRLPEVVRNSRHDVDMAGSSHGNDTCRHGNSLSGVGRDCCGSFSHEGSQKHPWQSAAADCTTVIHELKQCLPYPWIAVPDKGGLHILLLSRDEEKAIQRRAYFSYSGEVAISAHRKSIHGDIYEDIVKGMQEVSALGVDLGGCSPFVQHVMAVVQRFKRYEVCVGVNDRKFIPLWEIDKGGEIDKNPFGELRYKETFRPFNCNLLVSSATYLRQRCHVCIKTANRFRVKIKRHSSVTVSSNTPNIHLDKFQLLNKVAMQQKKVKHIQAKVTRLRIELERALSNIGGCNSESKYNELLDICLAYTTFEE